MTAEPPDDAMFPWHWIKEHFVPRVSGEKRDMSTQELAKHLGHSATWWQDRARKGEIAGAYQVTQGSPWYIPLAEATVFLDAYRESQTAARSKRHRKPWKGPRLEEAS